MNSFSECLNQISSLTAKNLQILKMINDSFFTKKNHLVSVIDGQQYVIPSFLSLESKIDNLAADFHNLVDAPKTGEAFTYYDGTTQKMELFGYANTPPHVDPLKIPDSFYATTNHIFKDFMSPTPSVRFDIGEISNNIKHVCIKKVVLKNSDLINLVEERIGQDELNSNSGSGNLGYADLIKMLFNFIEDVDYINYDTIKRLPIRMDNPSGEYQIVEIVDNWQDSDFDEHYILKLDRDLVYYIQNGTLMRNIMEGDRLVTYDEKVIMEVESVNPVNRNITVRILYGAYANLVDASTGDNTLSRLRFQAVNDNIFDKSKYVEVPLEEDQYVCIFIAPINDTTNTQADFNIGVFLDTYQLTSETEESFEEYYKNNVNNIGDALFALTNMMNDDDQVEKLTGPEYSELLNLQPVIDSDLLTVTQINKHLNDSETIQKIRNLYSQKSKYKNELDEAQRQIDNINNILADISFDDSIETREAYKSQLREFNARKKELTQNITSIIQEISENANSSDTPIENAKYHIRGFIDIDQISENLKNKVNIIGIDVQYRYKNQNKFIGNAITIGNKNWIFSDWNHMDGQMRKKLPEYNNASKSYKYSWEELNEDKNEISFNQVDIPITQGENVDVRVRFIYNLGWPLICFMSDWSNITNIEFPEEFTKDVEILDIISENNTDIKNYHFQGILEKEGVIDHVNDRIIDMDLTYFHQSEHIASGFYTDERRVIPLFDKLKEISQDLANLKIDVNGANAPLDVTISNEISTLILHPGIINKFRTTSYDDSITNGYSMPVTIIADGQSSTQELAVSNMIINIYNPTDYSIKLYSMFPGDSSMSLNNTSYPSRFDVYDYMPNYEVSISRSNENIWMYNIGSASDYKSNQKFNQFLYFRYKTFNDIELYRPNVNVVFDDDFSNNLPSHKIENLKEKSIYELQTSFSYTSDSFKIPRMADLYPYISDISDITAPAGVEFYELKPGESIQIPINYTYWFGSNEDSRDDVKTSRAISFDIWTSRFANPITYTLIVEAHKEDKASFKLKKINAKQIEDKYTPKVIKTTNLQQKVRKR